MILSKGKYGVALGCVTLVLGVSLTAPVKAAEVEAIAAEAATADYQSLKAIVAFLTAYKDAREAGKATVDTTLVTALAGNVVQVNGTIVRQSDSKMMEICGPMVKGQIDWGDGTKESLHGLGCSGDIHQFSAYHAYDKAGSYRITVTGGAGADGVRVVAVNAPLADNSTLLRTSIDGFEVTASGTVLLDGDLPRRCEATTIATIFWGDGSSEAITTDCAGTAYELRHAYATPGTYKVLVIDTDGDAMQTWLTLSMK